MSTAKTKTCLPELGGGGGGGVLPGKCMNKIEHEGIGARIEISQHANKADQSVK